MQGLHHRELLGLRSGFWRFGAVQAFHRLLHVIYFIPACSINEIKVSLNKLFVALYPRICKLLQYLKLYMVFLVHHVRAETDLLVLPDRCKCLAV